jgi:transglutaminase/protease-like cytokinesis protein 3
MKKIVLISLFLSSFFKTFSQNRGAIEKIVEKFPDRMAKPEKLAELINANFTVKEDKAIAAYIWIASNIKYDVKGFFSGTYNEAVNFQARSEAELLEKRKEYESKLIEKTLKNQIGVCNNYSKLYKRICDLTGVECIIENGFSKTMISDIGRTPQIPNHAWNKVKIGEEWRGVDATWGAGNVDFEKQKFMPDFTYNYCLVPLQKINLNHLSSDLPKNSINQAKKDFSTLPLFFGQYIGSSMEIMQPTNGIITLNGAEKVDFIIKNFPDAKTLTYSFGNEPMQEITTLKKENENTSFEIAYKKKNGTFLILWLDNKPLAIYRINLK